MAVTFKEYNDSPTFSITAEKIAGKRHGFIAWSDLAAYFVELWPAPILGIPQLPAQMPDNAGLYAMSMECGPEHPDGVIQAHTPPNTYDEAEVTVSYETQNYDQADPNADQIVTRRVTVGGQFMTIPNTGLEWVDTGDPIDNPEITGVKIIGHIDHHITLHRVPAVPWATIRSLVGKVNDAAFEGAAAETLLLQGVELQQGVTSDGSEPFQVTLQFRERNVDGDNAITWNFIFDGSHDQGKWREIQTKDGAKVYPVGDFDSLF